MLDTLRPKIEAYKLPLTAIAMFLAGGGAGAIVAHHPSPPHVMAPLVLAPIKTLAEGGSYSVKGRVEQVYGGSFVVADQTGRALIQFGMDDDDKPAVSTGQTVLVQGRMENGTFHADYLIGPEHRILIGARGRGSAREHEHGERGNPHLPGDRA